MKIIRSLPDLGHKFGVSKELSASSKEEHASAGLDQLNEEEFELFQKLNTSYRNKFEFPFVICVKENTKQSVVEKFIERTKRDARDEIETALSEFLKIVRIRVALLEG